MQKRYNKLYEKMKKQTTETKDVSKMIKEVLLGIETTKVDCQNKIKTTKVDCQNKIKKTKEDCDKYLEDKMMELENQIRNIMTPKNKNLVVSTNNVGGVLKMM